MTLAAAFLGLMTSVGPAGLATAAPAPAPAPAAIAAPAAPENVVLAFQDATQPADEVTAEPAAEAPPQLNERGEPPLTPVEQELLDERRRPDIEREHPDAVEQDNPGAIRSPPPEAFPSEYIPIPDRWRLIQSLGVVTERWWDPYNQNTLKGDRPMCVPANESEQHQNTLGCRAFRFLGLESDDWFVVANAVSDTVFEPRSFPIPVGVQTTQRPGSNDVFGRNNSIAAVQTFIFGVALIKGSTAYKPPDVEWRVTLAAQANYVDVPERRILDVRPSVGSNRFDYALGVQEAFIDYHLLNTSYRYDFYSLRLGIQTFNLDFRGFLFQDQQLGFRLFGNRDNNRFQFNFAAIWRLEKDTNSGLNNLFQRPRDDWILHANIYRQDFPIINLTSELSLTWNINREGDEIEIDDNGFPTRGGLLGNLQARSYDAFYIGYNADGHIGRLNLSLSTYALFGEDRDSNFTGEEARIEGYFAAIEPSVDFNWIRVRGAALFASGDGDPYDNVQHGYDAIFENPIFAGADTSYWIRQTVPFIGGARAINLNGRNGILNDLRSSKEQGQSNFVNPGTMLLGVGADFDLTPQWRLSTNVNHLWFHRTAPLEALRMQGTIRRDIGWDLSAALIWRPSAIQNVVFRLSGALLQPGTGFQDLFTNETRDDRYYSVLLNTILTY
ncbi:MAG: hypothetical protein ACXWUP_06305 [Allosphingosinicella sp.]